MRLSFTEMGMTVGWASFGADVSKDFDLGEFPGNVVVRTLRFHCWGHRFSPWLRN